jgi:hypothetical protein
MQLLSDGKWIIIIMKYEKIIDERPADESLTFLRMDFRIAAMFGGGGLNKGEHRS